MMNVSYYLEGQPFLSSFSRKYIGFYLFIYRRLLFHTSALGEWKHLTPSGDDNVE